VYDSDEFGYHPKLEVAYQTNATTETVRWSEVDDVERELNETLVNILEWSDLPTRGDTGNGSSGVFFGDAYFDATTEVERNLRVTDCPLPEIENEQDRAVQRVWGKMLDSDRAIFETLVTDGGEMAPKEAANEAGVSYRTVRRFADRCEEVVEHAYGKLEFTSLYARDEVLERLHSAREEFEGAVEDAVMGAANAADGRERSRWSEWKQKYNAQLREDADACRAEVRVRYEPEDRFDLQKLLTRAERAYRGTFDRSIRGVRVVVGDRTIDHVREFLNSPSVQGHQAAERHNFSEEVQRKKEKVDWEAWATEQRRRGAPD
jgi:hypothetical protein